MRTHGVWSNSQVPFACFPNHQSSVELLKCGWIFHVSQYMMLLVQVLDQHTHSSRLPGLQSGVSVLCGASYRQSWIRKAHLSRSRWLIEYIRSWSCTVICYVCYFDSINIVGSSYCFCFICLQIADELWENRQIVACSAYNSAATEFRQLNSAANFYSHNERRWFNRNPTIADVNVNEFYT